MDVASLSTALKRLRCKRGLSLSQLARRVNTSAATLSRYETGWERFELYTLSKIATALGYRLDIEFRSLTTAISPKTAANTVNKIKRLFWDHKLEKKDIVNYPVWVTERVIEYGSLDDVHSLIALMGRKVFLKCAAESRFVSPKTKKFWQTILEKEGLSCMKRSFPRDAGIY